MTSSPKARMAPTPAGPGRHALAVVLGLMLLQGCAGTPLQYRDLPPAEEQETAAVELVDVPFHPQKAYQCGPAALATVMNHAGHDITPEDLTPQVYLPERRGSLQAELLSSTRRNGLIPYVHRTELANLLDEVRAGNPVLVLQNLGIDRVPIWHYAVVVGYDLEAGTVLLRSGTTEREIMSLRRFERTWQRGDYWAMTVHGPGHFPVSAEEHRYLEAVASLERVDRWPQAEAAYRASLTRWPDSLGALMGLGNARYTAGDFTAAERWYRDAAGRHPESAAAQHNLAWALIRQDRHDEARKHATRAVALAGENQRHYHAALEELGED
jgi:tetratricopeptide (TPR) repeat protein